MDIIRRKRHHAPQQISGPSPSAPSLVSTPSLPLLPGPQAGDSIVQFTPTSAVAVSDSTVASAIGKSKSHNDVTGLSVNSRTSSINSSKSGFFHSYIPRAMHSRSRGSASSVRPSASSSTTSMATVATSSDSTPSSSSPQQQFLSQFPRKVLRKSHKRMSSSHDLNSRRGSTSSDVFSRVSRASTTMSGSSSSNVLDWRIQSVEMHTLLDYPESQSSKNRISYLVATADYIIMFRTKFDAFAALPQLANMASQNTEVHPLPKASSMLPPADPVHTIPLHAIISVFRVETMRPLYGIEVWWRLPYPAIATCSTTVYFKDGRDRENYLDMLASMVKIRSQDQSDASRVYYEVEDCIRKVFLTEEPGFPSTIPEIFPVVYRNAPDRLKSKLEDKQKKGNLEGVSSHYLVVGVNLCFFIQISRASAMQSTALELQYQTCGLVTLESFAADWSSRDERFAMRFRDPFKSPVGLELSSRHYRRIILTLTKADKFLKPAWPTQWQTQEIFHVTGLPVPQHIVAGEDYGGIQRTLSAYYGAYRCNPVDWEINWRTPFAPEFRVLPSSNGPYTDLQLLAVLRALRYNDYFKSLSFCDVNLSSLFNKHDSSRKGNVAYMNRSGMELGVYLTAHETSLVQRASILHQEFHALAFASGKIRQIDFTNCLPMHNKAVDLSNYSVQFLVPIMNLLAAGLTRCNRLILRGCILGSVDIESLAGYIAPSSTDQADGVTAHESVTLEALDVANCGLNDESIKLLFHALCQSAWTLQSLDVSQNLGRVPAALVQQFMDSVGSLRQLNLSGCITGTLEGELLPLEALDRLERLEELDVSNFQLNVSSLNALETILQTISARQASMQSGDYGHSLRRLVLNNCGISGYQAGRIINAMAGLYDVHIHLSSNPLEDGIDDLVKALSRNGSGRIGLHLNMIEFRDESSYIQLMGALASNRFIDFLSLVGTAPIPMNDDTCGDKTVEAIVRFLEANQSVRYLDLSGYCGKLDDGQLGKGFGRALRGLANNTTLTHLRARNQRLHDSTGTLGTAVQANKTLLYLDCGDNGFNATSLRYIAKSLESNHTLLVYLISYEELQDMLKHCVKDIPPPPWQTQQVNPKHKKRFSGSVDLGIERQRNLLGEELELAAAEIMEHTSRNIAKLQQDTGCLLDLDEASDTCGERGWPSLLLRTHENGARFTTTPLEEEQLDALDQETEQDLTWLPDQSPAMLHSVTVDSTARQAPVKSTTVTPNITDDIPYRVRQDDEALSSPLDGSGLTWDPPKTPKITTGMTKESLLGTSFLEKAFFAEPDISNILEKFTMADGTEYVICTRS
ncbi:hypothetical protein SEPCBS119000_006363 [Sporothrix epigloea]|uniref:LRR-containing protein second PH domain-containing protein n=1 Tax=Sporothrix epigloea TaxID=1892477 RepID=A0ABP0E6U1_9PEZI